MLKRLQLIIEHMDRHLQVFLFFMMACGLVIGSYFLNEGKITGADWVMMCGILYGSSSLGHGATQFGRRGRPNYPRYDDEDDGFNRPR